MLLRGGDPAALARVLRVVVVQARRACCHGSCWPFPGLALVTLRRRSALTGPDAALPDPGMVRAVGLALLNARGSSDLVALQEINPLGRTTLEATLRPALCYHVIDGRTGVWSRYPIRDARPIRLGPGNWTALHAVVALPTGPLAIWVAHPGRLRLGCCNPAMPSWSDWVALSRLTPFPDSCWSGT